jgi:hypothetical protein
MLESMGTRKEKTQIWSLGRDRSPRRKDRAASKATCPFSREMGSGSGVQGEPPGACDLGLGAAPLQTHHVAFWGPKQKGGGSPGLSLLGVHTTRTHFFLVEGHARVRGRVCLLTAGSPVLGTVTHQRIIVSWMDRWTDVLQPCPFLGNTPSCTSTQGVSAQLRGSPRTCWLLRCKCPGPQIHTRSTLPGNWGQAWGGSSEGPGTDTPALPSTVF